MLNLLIQIVILRKRMVDLGMRKGLRHPDVLKVSQDLDILRLIYCCPKRRADLTN
jgi:Spo0E like sporulation regulatory protein.